MLLHPTNKRSRLLSAHATPRQLSRCPTFLVPHVQRSPPISRLAALKGGGQGALLVPAAPRSWGGISACGTPRWQAVALSYLLFWAAPHHYRTTRTPRTLKQSYPGTASLPRGWRGGRPAGPHGAYRRPSAAKGARRHLRRAQPPLRQPSRLSYPPACDATCPTTAPMSTSSLTAATSCISSTAGRGPARVARGAGGGNVHARPGQGREGSRAARFSTTPPPGLGCQMVRPLGGWVWSVR